ncbi:MAG: small multi-drug export protein [Candidatus Thermoplasmatota archaeon]|nr:small multi-drug export protein [Candidatus Thermoplasmatota archaeon]MDP7076812.1 small multi-drug export protein [Desulfobacterales bacterium]MDP7264266.1 small multi-drug export protein [Candidatus Thermoplasmatota archaeon]
MTITQPVLDILLIFPGWLSTMMIAMLPIFELRGSIPVAIGVFKLPWWESYIYSVIGNMVPVPFILLLSDPVVRFFSRFKYSKKFFDYILEKTRKRTGKKIERYESLALVLFVAIPLPVTGAWTGAIAAWLFEIEFKKAMACVFLGVLIAGAVVTAAYHSARFLLDYSMLGFVGTIILLIIFYIVYRLLIKRNNGMDHDK